MAIPDYQSLMLPLLRHITGGAEHSFRDVVETLVRKLNLSEEDVAQRLPSGKQTTLENRVGWARWYLLKAGLLDAPRRGWMRIAIRGQEFLGTDPASLDVRTLLQFPEFAEFYRPSTSSPRANGQPVAADIPGEAAAQTPKESLEASYQLLRGQLAQELLQRVKSASPRFFEELVVDLLVAMGYGGSRADAGRAVGKSGDGGIDGIIKEDRLGLDVICLQAKRWQETVGRPTVQGFVGSLIGRGARKGVMITTSQFSKEALQYASTLQNHSIVLVGGQELAELMIDHGVGVAIEATYTVKRLDLDYFEG